MYVWFILDFPVELWGFYVFAFFYEWENKSWLPHFVLLSVVSFGVDLLKVVFWSLSFFFPWAPMPEKGPGWAKTSIIRWIKKLIWKPRIPCDPTHRSPRMFPVFSFFSIGLYFWDSSYKARNLVCLVWLPCIRGHFTQPWAYIFIQYYFWLKLV